MHRRCNRIPIPTAPIPNDNSFNKTEISTTSATSNIYDETAKWGETYYYDDETDDWDTPYEDDIT